MTRPVPAVSAETARAIDAEASASWGLDPFALVEAAGRNCARTFTEAQEVPPSSRTVVLAGSGNNAADALVMLRALILEGYIQASLSSVIINSVPPENEHSPRSEALKALVKMGVAVLCWGADAGCVSEQNSLAAVDLIIDGIAGTGLQGPLRGIALEMVNAVNGCKDASVRPAGVPPKPLVVSIDVPSGNWDAWEADMPIIRADATLAIEPAKVCMYTPAARLFAGTILRVGAVFPPALIEAHTQQVELLTWDSVCLRVSPVSPAAYKHERGVVEIRAGSPGFPGAARIAGRGAQAAGAGLVRLIVDESIYPILAASAGGVMVAPAETGSSGDPGGAVRFQGDAVLLGPGWGKTPDRSLILQKALEQEAAGVPLILDADAIALAGDCTFHGNCILTPHPGEFAAWSGLPKEAVLANPGPILTEYARKRRVTILFKSHVLYIAAEDGRLGILDGMAPVLAAGGSGDLLAGLCAALSARTRHGGRFDGYTCAAVSAALLLAAGTAATARHRFTDPLELADIAAGIAGAAWV